MNIESGFSQRMKMMQAIRMLGSGMDLGNLNDYALEICFLLIQNIFKRELTDNNNRTRKDMIFITEDILRVMKLEFTREIVERVVDGTLWYRDPNKQEGFNVSIFNDKTMLKEDYTFRYFKVDRENSNWEQGGPTVYMTTEESQTMIFITREILEEFEFDLEQFYTLQLIKTGNFSKARSSIDNLVAKVRNLINKEKEYRRQIIRNPQNIFVDMRKNSRKTENEIQEQFKKEQEVFRDMLVWRKKYHSLPEDKKKEAEMMFENLERARLLHDNLARHVMANLALELEIRVKYPSNFWNISNTSFEKDVWKNNIVKNGLQTIDDLEKVIGPLFSPEIEFIYPLDWAWSEQIVKRKRKQKKEKVEKLEEDWQFRETDWDLLAQLYEKVFLSILNKGSFSIVELNEISPLEKERWLSQKANIDIFMMFVISQTVLDSSYTGSDERLKLFNILCHKNPALKSLDKKNLKSKVDDSQNKFTWNELFISPYTLYIEE